MSHHQAQKREKEGKKITCSKGIKVGKMGINLLMEEDLAEERLLARTPDTPKGKRGNLRGKEKVGS